MLTKHVCGKTFLDNYRIIFDAMNGGIFLKRLLITKKDQAIYQPLALSISSSFMNAMSVANDNELAISLAPILPMIMKLLPTNHPELERNALLCIDSFYSCKTLSLPVELEFQTVPIFQVLVDVIISSSSSSSEALQILKSLLLNYPSKMLQSKFKLSNAIELAKYYYQLNNEFDIQLVEFL